MPQSSLQEYFNKGGMKHITSVPFHPSSNGQVERMVHTTIKSLKKMTQRNLEYKIANFLFYQRVTPCTTTGKTPAELPMKRRLRTVPDLIQEDADKHFEKIPKFKTDDQ
ncbi:hypothetical protein T12_5128, partial [Trichinella patagoniensis]